MRNVNVLNLFIILNALLLIGGCASRTYIAPVSDLSRSPSKKLQHHIVAKGDTLYSIAWRYNLNYKELAAANDLDRSFRIWPGQKLSLLIPSDVDIAKSPASKKSVAKKAKATRAKSSKAKTKRVVKPVPADVTRSKNKAVVKSESTKKKKSNFGLRWSWPISGPVISGFNGNGGLNKGIDVRAKLRQPVLAAEAGEVVYAGSGLRGYGQLLILKHSEKYLSAYAHNHRLMVKEGVSVKQGQKIAEAGSSGTNEVKLHFEIRLNGKPVDPIKYLPRKAQ